MKRRVIDKRRKEKYMLDDEYLNGQAKLCGWKGTIVYNSLCRHTNKAQECFPSIELIAEQHGVSRPTIIDGLNRLEKNRIIEIYKTKNAKGQWLNNTYILLDKSEWIYEKLPGNKRGKHLSKTQVNKIDVDSPSKQEYKTKSIRIQNQVNKIDSKETHIRKHIKGNTYIAKETSANKEIPLILNEFKEINPLIDFGNLSERKAVGILLKEYGFEKTAGMIRLYKERMSDKFCPLATKPTAFVRKMGDLAVYFSKLKEEENNKPKTIVL